jgi:GAF domain-containing protein
MSKEIALSQGTKKEKYKDLLPQLISLVEGESDATANLANISAALKETFSFFWVGFYLVKGDELVLGPFQGTIACTRIQKGKGVCGKAWEEKKTTLVEDVSIFPGHIACSSISKSEIVVPLIQNGIVIGVLDVDSEELANFDATDSQHLEELCSWLVTIL